MSNENENHGERIANLESSVKSIASSIESMSKKIDILSETVAMRSQTNWVTIFTGLGVVVTMGAMFWGAAINPINKDVDRAAMDAGKLALAVVKSDENFNTLQYRVGEIATLQKMDEKAIAYMQEHGTAESDKRSTVLEFQMSQVMKWIDSGGGGYYSTKK